MKRDTHLQPNPGNAAHMGHTPLGRLNKNLATLLALLMGVTSTGCASMFMKGGTLVDKGYKPVRVVQEYRAEGSFPQGATYQLVETRKGLAIFERSRDGSGTLFETRWKDEAGDHYAGWIKTSHGYEFVVPPDRAQPTKGYVYPKGYYSVKTIDGVARPVPAVELDPVRTLIPVSGGSGAAAPANATGTVSPVPGGGGAAAPANATGTVSPAPGGGGAAAPADGTEGGACYGNGTCNSGLTCNQASQCIRPVSWGQEGGPCYGNNTCNSGLLCEQGKCRRAGATGEEFGACYGNNTCNQGLRCDTASGRCVR